MVDGGQLRWWSSLTPLLRMNPQHLPAAAVSKINSS